MKSLKLAYFKSIIKKDLTTFPEIVIFTGHKYNCLLFPISL